jgi:hypothetical protein
VKPDKVGSRLIEIFSTSTNTNEFITIWNKIQGSYFDYWAFYYIDNHNNNNNNNNNNNDNNSNDNYNDNIYNEVSQSFLSMRML